MKPVNPTRRTDPAHPLEDTIVADHGSTPRHRRRRENGAARAIFAEARRAGLVQRHLRKLHHLAFRAAAEHSGTAPPVAGGTALSSSDPTTGGLAAPCGDPVRTANDPVPGQAAADRAA